MTDQLGRRSRRRAVAAAGPAVLALVAAILWIWLGGPGWAPATAGATATPGSVVAGGSGAPGSEPPSSLPPSASPEPSASPAPVPTLAPTPAPTVPVAALQGRLDSLQAKLSIPGVSVAILWDDGRQWLGAAGLSDVGAATPVTPDSPFAFASISKTFTAAVVLELVDEGRLALDEPVAPLLPADKLDNRITVRMLLDHTSGLPDFFLNPKIDAALLAAPDAAWTPARALSYVAAKRPVPGTTWVYSNTNYLLLGELVKAVTGQPLAAEVRRRLLDPLALTATWYQGVEAPKGALSVGYRLVATSGGGFRPVRVAPASTVMPFRSVVTAAAGAGGLAGTALDAARWMRAFAGGAVLSPAMQAAMLADVSHTTALKATTPTGLGIQVSTLDGHRALGHSGRFIGFRSVVRYLPNAGLTIAVFTNQSAVDPKRIAEALLGVVAPSVPMTRPPMPLDRIPA